MTNILIKLFVRNSDDTANAGVRRAYGTMVSIVGIILNVLLFTGKFIVGTISGSISIVADAWNNLSDAGSQVISLISFKIAAKPADRDHPFGHARIEYIASMIVSLIILVIGYELFSDSVKKIIHPVETEFHWIAIIVLGVSILVKLWLFIFNRKVAKRIHSSVMKATSADALSDACATLAVLISSLMSLWLGFSLDAYMGIIVAVLIVIAGLKILNEAKNSILGEAPDTEILENVRNVVARHPEALGTHDILVHNYGPNVSIATLHVEVDGSGDVFALHDVMDSIEKELWDEYRIHATVHMDPIVTDDEEVNQLRLAVDELAKEINPGRKTHDFRFVRGVTHSNLIFDIVVPFEDKRTDSEVIGIMQEKVRNIRSDYNCVIHVDRE